MQSQNIPKDQHGLVAVVGMACRFPGDAESPSKYWDLLKHGKDAYNPDTERWNNAAFYHANSINRQNVLPTKGGHLIKDDPYAFDAAFFNISGAEAAAMDPKQRIALEVAYEALENAGMPQQKVAGSRTACYIGSTMSDYRDAMVRDFEHYPTHYFLGNAEEMISNRISHFFDLHGPSATIETACSSSLVAIHLACQSLRTGESTMALAGGIGLILTPDGYMQLQNLAVLNTSGRSRSFDADSGGYGRGEGCGVVVLKPIDAALRDGDPIRAVIRGSGVNSDGWTKGVFLPSGISQAELIKFIYESNGIDYGSIQYVEAHGTGTTRGDPEEVKAIHNTIGQAATKDRKLIIGSVKPNIGHLEPAAGVASFIKGVLALEHSLIPPNIHFSKPNPAIPMDEWNMLVPTKLTPWPLCTTTKRMCVNSFGMGGTNAHAVLEAYERTANGNGNGNGYGMKRADRPAGKRLFVFSSHDQAGFRRLSASLTAHLDTLGPAALDSDFLANLAYTLATARAGLAWKASCVAATIPELREYLSEVLAGADTSSYTRAAHRAPRLGYVFTGQGAQWARMGVELLSSSSVFAASVARSAAHLTALGCSWDPVAELQEAESRLALPEISQPITTVLQIALVDELAAWGMKPTKVVGHSSGEIAAAYCAGALSHRDAVAVAYFRGKVAAGMKATVPGLDLGMMAVGCSKEEAEKTISTLSAKVTVACINSPLSVTLSGDTAALSRLSNIFQERQIFCRRLRVEVAYHSPHMRVVSDAYAASISDVEPDDASEDDERAVAMISSVTGKEVVPEMLGPYYWVGNLLSPVLFADAVTELLTPAGAESTEPQVDVLVEIGPHSALSGPIEQCLSHALLQDCVTYLPTLQRGQNSSECVLALAQALFHLGVSPLSIQAINGDSNTSLLTDLPPYTWKHDKSYNAVSRIQRELVGRQWPTRSLIGAQMPVQAEGERTWRGFIRLDDEPWLRGHRVGETVLLPGAGMVSMIVEAVQQLAQAGRTPHAIRLRDVSFYAALALTEDVATEVLINMRPHLVGTAGQTPSLWWEFTVSSSIGTAQLRDNCSGLITMDYLENQGPQMALEDASLATRKIAEYHRLVKETAAAPCSKEAFYTHIFKSGFQYSPTFQGVESVQMGAGKTSFCLRVTDIGQTLSAGQMAGKRPFLIHGATLDAVFQAWMGSTYDPHAGKMGFDRPFAPTHVGGLEIAMDIPGEEGYIMPGIYTSERRGFNELSADCVLFDEALQKVCLTVTDFRVAELDVDNAPEQGGSPSEQTQQKGTAAPSAITYEVRWDYALQVLQDGEVARLVDAADHGLAMLVRLALHDNPAASVVELTADYTMIPQAVLNRPELSGQSRWPTPISQMRHALLKGDGSESSGKLDTQGQPQPFVLGDQSSLLADTPLADILIVPELLSTIPDFEAILERFITLAAPSGTIFMAVKKDCKAVDLLERSGWKQTVGISTRNDQENNTVQVVGYKKSPELGSPQTNGHSTKQDLVSLPETIILQPSSPSPRVRDFCSSLQQVLAATQGTQKLSIKTWDSYEASANHSVISLLELDQPMLPFLSEPDFLRIKSLVLTSERLLWITVGDDPALYVVDGLARCIASEVASSRFQVLHLSDLAHGPQLAARIATIDTADKEFREDGDGLLKISRVLPSPEGNKLVAHHLENSTHVLPLAQQTSPLRLTIGRPGLLDTLYFIRSERMLSPLGNEEVEIQVQATGLNFKDVMAAMGLVPMSVLGLEAAGIVVKAGDKAAERFKPGDRVAVFAPGSFATTMRANYQAVASIPDTMPFEEAAAIPIVHTTAYHSLINLARLRKGQSILIHAAAGGVGQAAVQLAKYLGLVIYATVGSEDKRRLLCERFGLQEAHILHSRDTSFVKGIARLTGGRGVDCVLNSLSGELLRASWGCLAPFGTFVEIGLRDITNNTRLDMRPFEHNTTFTSCNMANLALPDLAVILDKTFNLVRQGHLSAAYPLTTYPIGQVGEAFRIMQQGRHRGKIILSLADPTATAPVFHNAKDSLKLDSTMTYLLVGGLGGLGRTLAREFVACGARHIAFISRSGASSPSAQTLLAELAASGATARAYRGDVTDEQSLATAMQQCEAEMPPVRGVVQLAMVLRDVIFEKMGYSEWTGPLRPKVEGTLNLHRYFGETRPLDFFIATSSVSGIWGYPSQVAYAAGNTFEDAMAHYRRRRGLKAVSVNLGIISGVGMVVELSAQMSQLEVWEQVLGIREPVFVALMKSIVAGQLKQVGEGGTVHEVPPQVTTGLGSADVWAAHHLPRPYYLDDPRFGALAVQTVNVRGAGVTGEEGGRGVENGTASLAARLGQASSIQQAVDMVKEALVAKTAQILQMPASEVDPSLPLYRYGVDSLVAIEVRNWITREMKANIALLEIMAAVPIKDFAVKITEKSKLVAVS